MHLWCHFEEVGMRRKGAWSGLLIAAVGFAVAVTGRSPGHAQPSNSPTSDAAQLADEAYVYGYPLVTTEMTRRVMTNVAAPDGMRGPMGRFVNLRTYPT